MICVSLVLGYSEVSWERNGGLRSGQGFESQSIVSQICWLRYVDDILCISYVYCSACLLVSARLAYHPIAISPVSGLDPLVTQHVWTDIVLCVHGWELNIWPKNPNRAWLISGGEKQRESFCPWMGVLPQPFGTLRATLIGRMARSRQMGLNDSWQAYRVLEDLVELACLDFPLKVLRKLAHSLPASSAALAVRQSVRRWDRAMKQWGNNAKPEQTKQQFGREYKGKHFTKDSKEDGKSKSRRRAKSSSSDSSSSSARHKKKLNKSRRRLARQDSGYRNYLAQQDRNMLNENAQIQATALKEALSGCFDTIKSAGVPPPSFPPQPPAGEGVGSAGSGGPPPATGGGLRCLSTAQGFLLEAGFNNMFKLQRLDCANVIRVMQPFFKPPKNKDLVRAYLAKYAPSVAVPMAHQDTLDAIFDATVSI